MQERFSGNSATAAMTYVALILGHVHGVLDIRRDGHQVVYGLAPFLLIFGLVHFLQYEKNKTKNNCNKCSHDKECVICFAGYSWGSHTPLTSFLISLLWAVSRVSDKVVKEPLCISFLLASLYLLWRWNDSPHMHYESGIWCYMFSVNLKMF